MWQQDHEKSIIGEGISCAAPWPWNGLVHSMIFYWQCVTSTWLICSLQARVFSNVYLTSHRLSSFVHIHQAYTNSTNLNLMFGCSLIVPLQSYFTLWDHVEKCMTFGTEISIGHNHYSQRLRLSPSNISRDPVVPFLIWWRNQICDMNKLIQCQLQTQLSTVCWQNKLNFLFMYDFCYWNINRA